MDDLISRAGITETVGFIAACSYGDPIDAKDVLKAIEEAPTITAEPVPITGDTSDGYHTFNELYHHRAVLFSVICNDRPNLAWKSHLHHDGTMYEGMFIVGIQTPEGQATYHYDIDPYWDMFSVRELFQAPEWDGHTPDEAIRRIGNLAAEPVRYGDWVRTSPATWECSVCRAPYRGTPVRPNWLRYCYNCGAKMGAKEDAK